MGYSSCLIVNLVGSLIDRTKFNQVSVRIVDEDLPDTVGSLFGTCDERNSQGFNLSRGGTAIVDQKRVMMSARRRAGGGPGFSRSFELENRMDQGRSGLKP